MGKEVLKRALNMVKIEPFEKYPRRYDKWFVGHRFAYESELRAIKELLPIGMGIEIGVGTGRFAKPLGIDIGLEPSREMSKIARKRGINVISGVAEKIPFKDSTFDFELMVTTLCFLDNVEEAFREVYRTLRVGGYFINGFVDRESFLGRIYEKNREINPFYKFANFYSVDEVVFELKGVGFKNFKYNQTIFHGLSDIKKVEPVKPGYGEGSFIVVRAEK